VLTWPPTAGSLAWIRFGVEGQFDCIGPKQVGAPGHDIDVLAKPVLPSGWTLLEAMGGLRRSIGNLQGGL